MGLDSVSPYLQAAILTLLYIAGLVVFGRRASRGTVYRWLLVAFTLGMLAAGVIVGQNVSFRSEQRALESRTREVSRAVDIATTVAARLPDFRREVERKNAVLEALRKLLPQEHQAKAFFAELERLAADRGATIELSGLAVEPAAFYERATLLLKLEGDAESVTGLERDLRGLSRITRWQKAENGAVSVEIFALNHEASPDVDLCEGVAASPDSAVWFPPFHDRLEETRHELAELCQTYERLLPIHRQVRAYQTMLQEVEEREALIERLKEQK